jgi:hypothetical protein
MTFPEVIAELRRVRPGANLGETAKFKTGMKNRYYDRAIHLTNFEMYQRDPLRYGAMQSNRKTMWLYIGTRGTICCGDKRW